MLSSGINSPTRSPFRGRSPTQKLNQDQILKSIANSITSKISGSLQESFSIPRKEIDIFQGSVNDRIQHISNQINKQVNDLDNKLDTILEKHEKDFLTAYRYHMLKVQKELVSLKQRANENELKTQQEKKLNSLEQQTNKLRNECMRIRELCDKQEQEIARLNQLRDELEDDRKFLDFEIRDARQQNRMLKITLSKTHNQCEDQNQMNQTTREEILKIAAKDQEGEVEIDNNQEQRSPVKANVGNSFQYSLMEKQTEMTTGRQKLNDKSLVNNQTQNYYEDASGEIQEEEDENMDGQDYGQVKEKKKNMYATFMDQQANQQILDTEYTNDNMDDQQYLTMQSGPKKLKYMTKVSKGFRDGEGPVDLKKTFMYNHKLTQQIFDIIQESKSQQDVALSVEQVFADDFQRRREITQHLREKLQAQILVNQQKQKRVEEQKKLIAQKKQAQLLVQTFKNCIEAVVSDKKEKHSIQKLSKEDLFPSEKKRVLELFVENDNTLSHLLEFISSKLIDQENSYKTPPVGSVSSIYGNSQMRNIQSSNKDQYNRNSLLSGAGEILHNQDIQYQSTNAQLQGLPVQTYSSERQSTMYLTQQQKLRQINTNQQSQNADYSSQIQTNMEPINSQGSKIRNDNIQSKTTLQMAGQASINKSSKFSGGMQSSQRNLNQYSESH